MDKPRNFVSIDVTQNYFDITWAFQTFYKDGEGERKSCFIPAFDIYFQAKNFEDMNRKSKIITEMFFDYYIVDEGKNSSLKKLALKLHGLGFKAPNDMMVMKAYTNQRPIAAKFSSNKVSSNGFTHAQSVSNQSKKHVACPA